MVSDKPGLLAELKRRHVWRVAVAYAIAAWLLIQIATQVFPFFDIPNWTVRLVVVLLAIGFPAAVVLAWVYEITPEGIRRTEPAGSPAALDPHAQHSMGRKLNGVIMVALVLSVAAMGWRMYALDPRGGAAPVVRSQIGPAAPAAAAVAAAVPDAASVAATSATPARASGFASTAASEKSLAVLPFANESGNGADLVFSDGLSQDLINALSQFEGLKVISRNSAFQFRDSKESASDIGRKLGVAHLLEGSVQRAADQVRITATLVNAADGTIVWSQHYDRPYQDLFALQDAITRAVAEALQARLVVVPGAAVQSDRPPGGDLAAYTAYQRGVAQAALNTEAGTRGAIDAFNEATRLDPRYAVAYAQLATRWLDLFIAWGVPAGHVDANARDAVDIALRLDPDSSLAHQAHSEFLRAIDMDYRGAEAEARRALELAPGDPEAAILLANMRRRLGNLQGALELTRHALDSNPRHASWHTWMSMQLIALGRLEEARQHTLTAIALLPGGSTFHLQLAMIEILRGNPKAALAEASQESNPLWRRWGLALAAQIGNDRAAADAALQALITEQGNTFAYSVAEVYALRGDADRMFEWMERSWTQRDPGVGMVLSDPMVLRYRDDPRFAAFCRKAGLPTTTDAVAMR